MDFAKYRSLTALNWSSLSLIETSPRLYAWRQDHPRPDTASLSLGRLAHVAVLEPERYETDCVRRPDRWDSWRSNAAREWRDEQLAAGREVLTDEDAEVINCILVNLGGHDDATRLLDGTRREETIEWPVDGVQCKGRVDAIADDRIVDFKTTRDLAYFMRRGAAELLYHGQLAWYLDGAIAAGRCSPDAAAYVVAAETGEPYDVAAMRLGEASLDAGRRLWRRLLECWLACRTTGMWPGMYPHLTTLELPGWAAGMWTDDEEEI